MTALGCVIIAVPAMLYTKLSYISVFWFYAAASVIVYNDSAAYFCGRLLGRHKLTSLSPNKTIVGFVGALILTALAGFFQPKVFASIPFFFCPDVAPFDLTVECARPGIFVKQDVELFNRWVWHGYPAQIHGLVLALFASLIALFGELVASALKKHFKLKGFGDVISEHGGILDLMDCQLVMGSFALLYIKSLNLD
jgi:phosphatidate cytidylyltransferase